MEIIENNEESRFSLYQAYKPNAFKTDFWKLDQHTGAKWLIHGPKRRMHNQLQSLELSSGISQLKM